MSNLEYPGERPQGSGKCFKGVENFLKRVAFNLGNTPSRTEVKIISCIPIDVSDLQQKIIYLEKQLEDVRNCDDPNNTSSQKRVINTVFIENKYPAVSDTGVSCNALEMEQGTNPYDTTLSTKKKSNVSFAIPSAHESRVNSSSSHQYEVPYTPTTEKRYADIMGYDNDLKQFTVGDVKQHQGRKKFFKKKKKAYRHQKHKNHYVYYAQAGCSPFNKPSMDDTCRNNKAMTRSTRSYMATVIDKQYTPQVLGGNLSDISTFSSPICRDTLDFNTGSRYDSDVCSCCHGAFCNTDNHPIVYDDQKVYRADNITTNGGFYDSTFYDVVPVKEKSFKVKKPDTPKKREAKPSVDIMCWPEDVRTKLRTYPLYNPFYFDYTAMLPRTDNNLRKAQQVNKREPIVRNVARHRNYMDKQIYMEMSKSSCIDFGDVYPKLVRKKNDGDRTSHVDKCRIERCLHVDKCLPATEVPHKVDAECLTIITNNSECQTVSSIINTNDSMQSSDDKTEETLNQIKTILQSVLHEVKVSSLTKGTADEKPKKDATVQKGASQAYMPGNVQGNLPGAIPVNGNMQTSLLDTISGMPHSNIVEGIQTNSPGNIQGSRLLNSYTYSPYDIPPNLPTCSKQMNPNPYYYSQPPLKCYQNFPLIIPNQGRPNCASCFGHGAYLKSHYPKQATTIATNTESAKAEHSKETEKLIKEIYKSMALTMGAVKNETSSEYEPLHDFTSQIEKSTKTVIEKPTPVKEYKKVTNVVQAVSELFRKRDMQTSSESHNLIMSKFASHRETPESRYGSQNTNTITNTNTTNTGTGSKQTSTDTTVVSGLATTTTDLDVKLRKERVDTFWNQSKRGMPEGARHGNQNFQPRMQKYTTQELLETSSSETETDDTYVPEESKQVTQKDRKEKTSLFSKMFRSVKLFKPRDRKKHDNKEAKAEEATGEDTSTDSDDYQTVYSQKIEATPKHRPRAYNLPKRRTHSKISYRHVYQRDKSPEKVVRRHPYMEQEYRQYWNEKLMFQDNKYPKYSTDHPYSSQHYPGEAVQRMHPYYQTYEARAAVVEPTKAIPRNIAMNAKRTVVPKQIKKMVGPIDPRLASKAMPWLKNQAKKRTNCCGEHIRRLIYEN